jgi:NUC153 domain
VKLTWDGDDPQRSQVTRRALTRKEMEESDFKAYIANTSSESESDAEDKPLPSKKTSREKLRALLLGGNDEAIPEGWVDDGAVDDVDMEITFTPGLSEKQNKVDETTLERYQRKMKEKKKRKKEEGTGKKVEGKQLEDDFFEQASDEGALDEDVDRDRHSKDRPTKGKMANDQNDASVRPEVTAEELALLVASDNPNTEPKHFNLKSVIKAEKQKKRKKGRKAKGDMDVNETQEDFILDVKDERFKALHEDYQFAIDPSNPQYVSFFPSRFLLLIL